MLQSRGVTTLCHSALPLPPLDKILVFRLGLGGGAGGKLKKEVY